MNDLKGTAFLLCSLPPYLLFSEIDFSFPQEDSITRRGGTGIASSVLCFELNPVIKAFFSYPFPICTVFCSAENEYILK